MTCQFHKTETCMENGSLSLWLHTLESEVVEQGSFCTLSAVSAWCLRHEGIPGARKGDLGAKRRPRPAHPELRPEVANRQPRRSLAPRRD